MLNKTKLISDLQAIFEKEGNTAASVASDLADAFEGYVKSGTVTVTALTGQIQVQGSPTAQANAAPITITGESSTSTGGIT